MVPSGPPTPVGGAQPMPPSLLRSNSAILSGTQASSIPSQQPFSSLISPRTQFNNNSNSSMNNNINLLGNISNVSSLLNNSFGNGGAVSVSGGGFSAASVNLQQRGAVGGTVMHGSAELDPLSFASTPGSAQGQHFQNHSSNQLPMDHIQPEQIDGMPNFQRQFSLPHNLQQAHLRGGMGAAGSMTPVKLEPQIGPDKNVPAQNLQSLRTLGAVKLEQQQLQPRRNMGSVKQEGQHSDSTLFLQMQMSRPSSQATAAQISLLQQQRILQLQQQQQQQQQQQIFKSLPQQRNQLQQQVQQIPLSHQIKPATYEPGTCAQRLTHYMYHQQHRPDDNNIEFWKKFVSEYFAPNAKKRWCVSLYGSGRQTTGVFPQDAWHCEICNRKPGRGFETTVEVLPRLMQIKYASGTLEELLYVDMPREYQNASGQIVLDYAKAVQESVFEQLRVVREGQLRIIFSPDLKICSWEFCARRHEELIPRRLLIPQVSQLGAVVQKYQNALQNASSPMSTQDLQSTCNSFVASARQLAKALEVPLVNDLGYTKRYVRCLQISEVVNCMKDLIDYSTQTGSGPMDSLINFPRRNSASGLQSQQVQQAEEQQTTNQSSTQNDQSSAHLTGMQLCSGNNSMPNDNNSLNNLTSTCTSISALAHQNSANTRQENQVNTVNGSYVCGTTVPIPSASSSNSLPTGQLNTSSPFPSPTLSTSNNINTPTSHSAIQMNSAQSPATMSKLQQTPAQSLEADPNETQSSVQQILQELMMSSHINGMNNNAGNELKGINGITRSISAGSCLTGNGTANNACMGGMGYGNNFMMGSATTASGLRTAMANNAMSMNVRVGMNHLSQDPTIMNHQQQQDISNRLMGGFPQVNNFNNLQFDWKPSP